MATAQHTPGPWTSCPEDLRGGRYWVVNRGPASDDTIDIHQDDNGEADARLIAAAPDLLAALKLLVEKFDTFAGAPFKNPPDSPWLVARAAIAKAEA